METIWSHEDVGGDGVVSRCAAALAEGGVIVYPTDTVYGLGADASSAEAVAKVRALKGREEAKPLLATVADLAMLESYAEVTPLARKLAAAFWPGPLSLILAARDDTLAPITGTDGTIGFRMPDQPFCLALARAFGKPITSTSVNRSGAVQPRSLAGMLSQLDHAAQDIALTVDVGELPGRTPSTIVDVRGAQVRVVREGAITRERLSTQA